MMENKIDKVHKFLEDNGIGYQTHRHPPLPTIELALEYWKGIIRATDIILLSLNAIRN